MLKAAGGLAAAAGLSLRAGAAAAEPDRGPASAGPPANPWRGLKVGMASYSFRKLSLDDCIKGIRRVALRYVSIKDFHLPLKSTTEERKRVAQRFRDAGIMPISCGVITIKDEAAGQQAFEYARDIGVPTIVCSPAPEVLPALDRMVKEHNIRLAIHNHGPEDKHFKSPYDVWQAVQNIDPRVGLCIDVGHCARAGADPARAIRDCKARLYDLHFKDISSPAGRSAAAEVEVGRGVLDIRGMLEALLAIDYPGHVGFEHEKDPDDPVPGAAESVGFTRATLRDLPGR